MPKGLKSALRWTALTAFALATLYVGSQLALHRHTGILRVLSGALNTLRTASQTTKPQTSEDISTNRHRVTLTWQASPSPRVRYNVYRRDASGTPRRINGAPVADLNYTDNYVQPGHTYFYTTRSINEGGVESHPSNEVRVDVPSP